MASNSTDSIIDFSPYFRILTDGTVHRLNSPLPIPPSSDPLSPVRSKDVLIDPSTGVSVRIFAPNHQNPPQKLPLVIYIHGGAFCIGSPSSPPFHNFISKIVEKANVIAVSIDYRLAPENPMPIPYEDSWTAFNWISSHSSGNGADPWLNELADFKRVFLGGESAGANIANDVALRIGDMKEEKITGVEIEGMFLMHPYFGVKGEDKLYKHLFPGRSGGEDDWRLNPAVDGRIGRMAGRRAVMFLAEKDGLNVRAKEYAEALKRGAWEGEVEVMETEGEGHCFYLHDLGSEKAVAIVDRLALFLKGKCIF